MERIQELLYGHAGEYVTRTYHECMLSEEQKINYIKDGLCIERGTPSQKLYFDSKGGKHNFVGLYSAQQEGIASHATYKHIIVCPDVSITDIKKGKLSILTDFSYASPTEVKNILNGSIGFAPGWKCAEADLDAEYDFRLNKKLMVQIVCDAIHAYYVGSTERLTVVVPKKFDLIRSFRSSVKQLLECVPYGLWTILSFSANESGSNPACRIGFVREGTVSINERKLYRLDTAVEKVETELHPSLVKLIKECVFNSSVRDQVYYDFEQQYGNRYPRLNDYMTYADVLELKASSNIDWQFFKGANDILSKTCADNSMAITAYNELTKRITTSESLSNIVVSRESCFLRCQTIKELEKRLSEYRFVLRAFKERNMVINKEASSKLMDLQLPNRYEELKDVCDALSNDCEIRAFLHADVVNEFCMNAENSMRDSVGNAYRDLENKLKNGVKEQDYEWFKRLCEGFREEPYYNQQRFEEIIIAALQNPDGYRDTVDKFESVAKKYVSSERLSFISDWKSMLDGMKGFTHFLQWRINQSSGACYEKDYLNAVFKNLKRKKYKGGSVEDLILASVRASGEYSHNPESEFGTIIKSILEHEDFRLVVNKKKKLAEIYKELIYCQYFSVGKIKLLNSAQKEHKVCTIDAIKVLARLFVACDEKGNEFALDSKEERDFCSFIASNSQLSQAEKGIIKRSRLKSTPTTTQEKPSRNREKRTYFRRRFVDNLSVMLFVLVILAILIGAGLAIFLIAKNNKDSDKSQENTPIALPLLSPAVTETADPVIETDASGVGLIMIRREVNDH